MDTFQGSLSGVCIVLHATKQSQNSRLWLWMESNLGKSRQRIWREYPGDPDDVTRWDVSCTVARVTSQLTSSSTIKARLWGADRGAKANCEGGTPRKRGPGAGMTAGAGGCVLRGGVLMERAQQQTSQIARPITTRPPITDTTMMKMVMSSPSSPLRPPTCRSHLHKEKH